MVKSKKVEIFFMCAIGMVILAISIMLFAAIFNLEFAKDWDVLAFTGSIIGGIITYYGVVITIKKQNEAELMRDSVKRKKASYGLYQLFGLYQVFIDERSCEEIVKDRNRSIDILGEFPKMIEISSELNREVFDYSLKFQREASILRSVLLRDKQQPDELVAKNIGFYKDELKKYYNLILAELYLEETEYNELRKKKK